MPRYAWEVFTKVFTSFCPKAFQLHLRQQDEFEEAEAAAQAANDLAGQSPSSLGYRAA
jgi:hypothetical protein